MRKILAVVAISGFLLSCSEYRTTEALDGEFIRVNSNLVLVSPNDHQIFNDELTFSWEKTQGISEYILEIATDADFANIINSVTTSDFSYTFNAQAIDFITLFWRVRSGNNSVISEVREAHRLEKNVLYVDGASTATISLGNKTSPLKSIADALAIAKVYAEPGEVTTIKVAGGTFNQSYLINFDVKIYGGYNKQTWQRDMVNHASIFNCATTCFVILAPATIATELDGFTLNYSANVLNEGALRVESGGAATLRKLTVNVTGGAGNFVKQGLIFLNSTAVVENSDFYLTGDQYTKLIYAVASNLTVRNNNFEINAIGNYVEAFANFGGPSTTVINNNYVNYNANATSGGNALGFGPGISPSTISYNQIRLNGNGDGISNVGGNTITHNLIHVNGDSGKGINQDWNNTANISNNTIYVEATNSAYGIWHDEDQVIATNNIVYLENANSYAYYARSFLRPTTLTNNLFFGNGILYREGHPAEITYSDIGSDELLNGAPNNELDAVAACGNTTCSNGNISSNDGLSGVFGPNFDVNDFSTWAIAPGGDADIAGGGDGYGAGDIGADAANAGVQP